MSTQIPFPNKRLAQAGIGNPLFVTDIENATEDLLEALATLYGFASNGFAILSGFDYGAGAYTGGIVYMNGVFYRCVAGLTENQYLTPDVQDVDNKIFSDANTYPTYRIYQAVAAGVQWGGMPQFVGNMNAYRVSINKVYDLAVQVVNSTETVRGIAQLASSAEVIAGTDTQKIVTPAGLEAKTATDARKGIVELATNAETQTGTDAERAVTPAALTARTATDTRTGVIELATNAEVQAGTDVERAVTPAGLESKTATESRKGIAEICDFFEVILGVDDERIVTAKKIKDLLSSTFGTTTLVPYAGMPTTVTDGRVSYLNLGKLVFIDAQIEFNVNAPNDSYMFKNSFATDFSYLTPSRETAFGGELYIPGTGWTSCIFRIYILTTNLVVEIKTYNSANVNINTGYLARFNGIYQSI